MARPKAKPVSKRGQRESEIRRILVLDALRGNAAPGIAAAGVLLFWVLFNAELVNVGPALTVTSLLVLFILLHFGLRDFLDERTPARIAIAVGVFAFVWLIGLGWPLHATVTPPPPLFAGELRANGEATKVALDGDGGQYRVVVSGHMPATNDKGSHGGTYKMRLKDDGSLDEIVQGDFSETWRRQRIGRKGGLPVRVIHNIAQHRITTAGHDLNVSLVELTGDVGSSVSIEIFKQAVSTMLLTAIGVVLITGALVVDAWRTEVKHDGMMTTETVAALLGISAFRAFGAAHPGFGDLLINGMLGGLVGAGFGALLWWLTGARIRKSLLPAT